MAVQAHWKTHSADKSNTGKKDSKDREVKQHIPPPPAE